MAAGNTGSPYYTEVDCRGHFWRNLGVTAGHIKVKTPDCCPSRDVTETAGYRTLVSGERSGGLGGAVKGDISVQSHDMEQCGKARGGDKGFRD